MGMDGLVPGITFSGCTWRQCSDDGVHFELRVVTEAVYIGKKHITIVGALRRIASSSLKSQCFRSLDYEPTTRGLPI